MRTKSWSEIRAENEAARIRNLAHLSDAELTMRALKAEGEAVYDWASMYRAEVQRRQQLQAAA